MGIGRCVKCLAEFKENDVVATSTSQHYCYPCAKRINLVTGKIHKDLRNDEFIPEVLHHIDFLVKKLSISFEIGEYAKILIKTVFEKTHYVSKNQFGLACAAISLAFNIIQKNDLIKKQLPISDAVLQRNLRPLLKNLESINIHALSQRSDGKKN